jgi:hypothetical protein
MKALKSYARGIKAATSEGKLLLLLWLFNVLFAVMVYFLFSSYLGRVIGTSAEAASFLKGIDFNAFVEMLTYEGAGLNQIISVAVKLALAYGFFSIFLSGGILRTLFARRADRGGGEAGGRRKLAPLFFEGAGKYFGRFFRLFLYSLVLWAAVVIVELFFSTFIAPAFRSARNEALIFWMIVIAAVIGLFLAFGLMMTVDYARIKIVAEDSRAVLGSLFGAIGFVFRRLGKTLGLYYLFLLTGAALIGVCWATTSGLKMRTVSGILIAFLAGQVFVFLRGWVKVGLQAGQLDFFVSAEKAAEAERKLRGPIPESTAPVAAPASAETSSTGEETAPAPAPVEEAAPVVEPAPDKTPETRE